MPDDQHPADGIAKAIQGIFNGDTFVQGIRDAWDRAMAPKPAPAPTPDPNKDPYIIERQREALKSFQDAQAARDAQSKALTSDAATKIRAKANRTIGGK